ncbi:MAG: hypothetical protein UR46_C0004G0009, partial [Parcubacteria group bacterium GW2011_GWA1_33_6]
EFNNSNPVSIMKRREQRQKEKISLQIRRRRASSVDLLEEIEKLEIDIREKLVDILAFCFMPNHIHLLLKQITENGLHDFMVKLGSGYGRYFNQKHQRKGYVFQNRFRSVIIKDDNQLMMVINYIHANPISLIEPNFKEQGIKKHSIEEVVNFLKTGHRWSSFPDYVGIKNFPSVTERIFVTEFMGKEKGIINNMTEWVSYKKDPSLYGDVLLE